MLSEDLTYEQVIDDQLINSVIGNCEKKECFTYYSLFLNKAREAESNGDRETSDLFALLGSLCSLHLDLDSKHEPYKAYIRMHHSRSAIVDDFTSKDFEIMRKLLNVISDVELKARIGDVLWVCGKDHKAASCAVSSYIDSFNRLFDPDHWVACAERIERAVQIAVQLGRKNEPYLKTIEQVENALTRLNGEDKFFLSGKLMEILQEYREGNPAKYISIAEKLALGAEGESNWHRARHYWEVSSNWHKIDKDDDGAREKSINLAETYVKQAEQSASSSTPSYIAASQHLLKGIEAFRRVGSTQDRVNELHHVLIEYQQKSVSELMEVSSGEINIADSVKQAEESVMGKPFEESLAILATISPIPSVFELKTEVEEKTGKYALRHLFTGVAINESGKIVGQKPSLMSQDPKEQEAAIRVEMYEYAKYNRLLTVRGLISPARHQILLEHRVRVADLRPVVYYNPLVPSGREEIYAQGLYHGLVGDFMLAIHLLIPQLENSIRWILVQAGEVSSGLDAEGVQDEKNLNSLLFSSTLEQIIGEDLMFDLQGLLVERFGHNLRNRVAHGLIDYVPCYSYESEYLWWIVLRLCYSFKITQKQLENEQMAINNEKTEEDK